MPSVWLDDIPPRDLNDLPGELDKILPPETRTQYGFQSIDFLQTQRNIIMICRILIWLMKDLKKLDPEFELEDSKQLVILICYLHDSLIEAFKIEAKSQGHQQKAFVQQKAFDQHCQALKSNTDDLKSDFESKNPEFLKEINEELKLDFGKLKSRTLLELVARIIAQKSDSTLSLEEYAKKFDSLEITRGLRDESNRNMNPILVGIPVVIFICIHTTDSDTTDSDKCDVGPWHVISTSKERWPGLKQIYDKASKNRDGRLQNFPDVIKRTEELWNTIEQNGQISFRGSQDRQNKKSNSSWRVVSNKKNQKKTEEKDSSSWRKPAEGEATKERMREARKAAVSEFQKRTPELEKLSHREKDRAAAFFVPTMEISGRCFKCQSLYPFTMHSDSKENESTKKCMSSPFNKSEQCLKVEGYPAGTCAEDLAYPICKNVNTKHPKVTTPGIKQKGKP